MSANGLVKYGTMMNIIKFTFLLLGISLGLRSYAHAIDMKDSAKVAVGKIDKAFLDRSISEGRYLDSVQKSIQLFQSNNLRISKNELLELLTVYREVIWAKENNKKFRKNYYAILSGQARMENRNAEMLYYAERLNELEQLDDNDYSVNSIFFIATYYFGKLKFAKAAELYTKHRDLLRGIPRKVSTLERKDLMRSGDALSTLCSSAYSAGDKDMGREIEGVIRELIDSVGHIHPSDSELKIRLRYSLLLSAHDKARAFNDQAAIWESIRQLEELSADVNTPDYLRSYLDFTILDKKALFYLDFGNNDSAAHYIDKMLYGAESHPMTAYMIKKYQARLLYNKGLYKASEDTLVQALIMLEAVNSTTGEEVDELMYTLTKVEDQQLMLEEAETENKRKEQWIRWVSFGGLMLLVLGTCSFFFIRQRQRRKFLEFKLNMARNVHDETGPALLYAKSLAKSCKVIGEDEKMRAELESHIENTMAVIRSLSHDLKSDKLCSIGSLIRETDNTLKKLKNLNVFNYIIKEHLKEDRFISHYQFSQLKAVLQECVTNSIKHAQFDHIHISFAEAGKKLTITYSDNGNGWEQKSTTGTGGGIGLNNMKERVRLVNGEFAIDSNFPEGYTIRMIIPLR